MIEVSFLLLQQQQTHIHEDHRPWSEQPRVNADASCAKSGSLPRAGG
jgi:hypothetical protein